MGVASVGADLEFSRRLRAPNRKARDSNHLEKEQRFRTPEVLRGHGVQRAMNVILQGDGRSFWSPGSRQPQLQRLRRT